MRSFPRIKPLRNGRLLVQVTHAAAANFNVINMSFKATCENKILAETSGFIVTFGI